MTDQEKYYRRSYNAINKLIGVYKSGYNKLNALKFRKELIDQFRANPKIAESEFENIKFTMMIALLGLNKEVDLIFRKFRSY